MKKFIVTTLFGLLLLNFTGYFLTQIHAPLSEVAYAQESGEPSETPGAGAQSEVGQPDVTDTLSDAGRTVLTEIQTLFSMILLFLNYLLWPLLVMIGGLMDNSLILGGGMEDRLLLIWGQIRNMVNLLFVVILIGAALYNVIGIGEEGDYAIKKLLPKFIMALILVNFSFLGAKIVLDAANIVTSAVFALPNAVEESFQLVDPDELSQEVCGRLNADHIGDEICSPDNKFTTKAREFLTNLNANNISFVMAVNMGQIHKGLEVSELLRENPNLINLSVNIIFSIVLYVAYVCGYLALFFVLIVRVVVLWVIIALSPVAALQFVVPNLISGASGGADLKDEFVKHAIAPIKIGVGMTIGYLMLDAYQRSGSAALGFDFGNDFANVFSSAGTLQELIIAIAAVAIVFQVSFSAANDTLARNITNGIQNWVRNVGTGIAKAPLLGQWIPVPTSIDTDGKITLPQLLNETQRGINQYVDDRSRITRDTSTTPDAFSSDADVKRFFRSPNRSDTVRNRQALEVVMDSSSSDMQREVKVSEFSDVLGNLRSIRGQLATPQDYDALVTLMAGLPQNQTLSAAMSSNPRIATLFQNAFGRTRTRPDAAEATTTTDGTTTGGTATGTQPPATGTQTQAQGTQPPATGTQPSATGTQPPATGTQPQAQGTQPPATAAQPQGQAQSPEPPATGTQP